MTEESRLGLKGWGGARLGAVPAFRRLPKEAGMPAALHMESWLHRGGVPEPAPPWQSQAGILPSTVPAALLAWEVGDVAPCAPLGWGRLWYQVDTKDLAASLPFCSGPLLGPLHRRLLLRETDDWEDSARRGTQRPGLVWGSGPAGLHGGGSHHFPSGQRLWLLPFGRPLQLQLPQLRAPWMGPAPWRLLFPALP